ncbi:DinB family protein [Roseovarius atlanticus]|uniref:DinB family protein n=1 Tax=Roseovarius atlanticus TaxID=1641875 RepID=UPI001C97DBA5|nr:DinB family protein [Roseovarius atlanticus]MBY5989276.1 damage-inducible protein DinB [Roseovarius atlanticus]MBY6124668.1 damage-inducible protein DinB [Roseovarius atlanticus]MBY6149163.1 damage-inducible protein DinB [Roseovarius atlanticus]
MITPEYCRVMARYNAWQNRQLTEALDGQSLEVLTEDRGAFFGSILGTLNHLLWGDLMWMARFDPSVEAPGVGVTKSAEMHPTLGAWSAARYHVDGKIGHWANSLRATDLTGDLHWYSGTAQRDIVSPRALCVTHMFNHQTHHRGQVHAMMTAAGLEAPVSDMFLMPGEG